MDSSTAEIYDYEEVMSMIKNEPKKFEDTDLRQLYEVSEDEIEQGYANFKTWAEALGLKLHTRQLRRNAERRYNKAINRRNK